MKTRRAIIGLVFCFAPLILFVALFVVSFKLNAAKTHLSVGNGFFIGVEDGRLSFFSDGQCGPYRGSIVFLVGNDGKLPPGCESIGFNFPGVYYRFFRLPTVVWTLTLSLAVPVALAAIPVEWWLMRRWGRSAGRDQRPWQFGLKDALYATFWFCAAAGLFTASAAGRYSNRAEFCGAIVAFCSGIGALCRRPLVGAFFGGTIAISFLWSGFPTAN